MADGNRTVLTRKLVIQVDEFSRGAEIAPVQKTLFDPARPIPLVQPRSDTEDRPRRPRADPPIRRTEAPVKRLFNPAIHDPHSFHPRPVEPARQDSGSSSRSLLRPAPNGRTPEEEADRERERRKRREGSERGSHASKRKDVDAKSKGSRSSEGSESLKDRERGKAKG